MARYTIESRCCSTFGMDVHARTTTVKGIDRRCARSYTGEVRRDGHPQVVEEPGLEYPAQVRLRLELENGEGRSRVDMDQGIRFLGEIGRFGRRACEGGPRLLHAGRRGEPRAGSGAWQEARRHGASFPGGVYVPPCMFQLGLSLAVGEGI